MKTSRAARAKNRASRSTLRTAIKNVRTANAKEDAQKALAAAIPIIDKMAQKGIIHRNTAARNKSRLTRQVNALES